ncbi:MAG: hypothetical protein EOP42_26685 [Sphingobacteriaceae bacterium]|nr:MAG: hypothetical protein EOP42_26685 [Sphingobacteriaceae bacterium]
MKATTALAGGLTGAVTLNLIHELYRQIDSDAPKIHLIGEEALVKMLKAVNLPVPSTEKELYTWTLTGDILSNTIYYSVIGAGQKKNLIRNGLLAGFAAGLGAVFMPEKMGLNDAPTTRTTETKLLSVLWYTLGGLTAGSVMKFLTKK